MEGEGGGGGAVKGDLEVVEGRKHHLSHADEMKERL